MGFNSGFKGLTKRVYLTQRYDFRMFDSSERPDDCRWWGSVVRYGNTILEFI